MEQENEQLKAEVKDLEEMVKNRDKRIDELVEHLKDLENAAHELYKSIHY